MMSMAINVTEQQVDGAEIDYGVIVASHKATAGVLAARLSEHDPSLEWVGKSLQGVQDCGVTLLDGALLVIEGKFDTQNPPRSWIVTTDETGESRILRASVDADTNQVNVEEVDGKLEEQAAEIMRLNDVLRGALLGLGLSLEG